MAQFYELFQDKQATTRSKIEERKRRILELSHRVLEVIIQQEIQRKSGLAIQTEEEQLRTQLEALNNQLRAPTQFRGEIFPLENSVKKYVKMDHTAIDTSNKFGSSGKRKLKLAAASFVGTGNG